MNPTPSIHQWTVWVRTSGTWRRAASSCTKSAMEAIDLIMSLEHGRPNVKLLDPIVAPTTT